MGFPAALVLSVLVSGAATLPPADCVQQLRAARLQLEAGNVAAGLRGLREAAEEFPDELVPVVELWSYHRDYGLPGDEAVALRALLGRRLADPHGKLPAGVLKYLVESPTAGEDELGWTLAATRTRLAEHPDDPELLEAVAMLEERLGRPDDARATLGRLLAVEPSDELRWRCAELDLAAERYEDAATMLASLVEREEPAAWARITYTRTLARLGRYDDLLRQLDRLGDDRRILRETLAGILLDAAWEFRDAGSDAEAEALFRQVLEADPDQREARAVVLHLFSDEAESRTHRAKLERRWNKETDPQELLDAGASLLATGDAEGAFSLLRRAAAGLPDNEIAWFDLGLAAIRLERWEDAETALREATAINAGRAESHFNLGIVLYHLQRFDLAAEALQQALTLRPDLHQAHYYLAACYRALGDGDAAAREQRLYDGG